MDKKAKNAAFLLLFAVYLFTGFAVSAKRVGRSAAICGWKIDVKYLAVYTPKRYWIRNQYRWSPSVFEQEGFFVLA